MRTPTNLSARDRARGHAKSLESRKTASKAHDEQVWTLMIVLSDLHQPKSLRELAALLDGQVPTRRGRAWNAQLVDYFLKKHLGRTPRARLKTFVANTRRPSHYEQLIIPEEYYQKYVQVLEAINEPSENNGAWQRVADVEPERFGLVRHADYGEGQFRKRRRLGLYRCSFIKDWESFEVDCRAVDLETFVWRRSREDRLAVTDLIKKRFEAAR